MTAPHVEKGYSLENAHCLQKMQACRYIVQDWSKANSRNGISLHTPKSNFELAKRIVRSHLQLQLQPQGAFQDRLSSFCIRRLWAPRRLIRDFKYSENVAQNCKFIKFSCDNFRTHQIFQEMAAPHVKKGIFTWECSSFAKKIGGEYASLSLCCTGLQQQVKSAYWNVLCCYGGMCFSQKSKTLYYISGTRGKRFLFSGNHSNLLHL